MKVITLKIDEKLIKSTDELSRSVGISRIESVKQAIQNYNEINRRNQLAIVLKKEMGLVERES